LERKGGLASETIVPLNAHPLERSCSSLAGLFGREHSTAVPLSVQPVVVPCHLLSLGALPLSRRSQRQQWATYRVAARVRPTPVGCPGQPLWGQSCNQEGKACSRHAACRRGERSEGRWQRRKEGRSVDACAVVEPEQAGERVCRVVPLPLPAVVLPLSSSCQL
jgi:hypothetical protein